MDKIIKNKRGLELVTSLSSGYETISKKLFISFLLWDQVWWCSIKWFLSYSKTYICKFMQANSWYKLFHFHLFFWIWNRWKGRGKITKIWLSREWKELFRWNKKDFSQFLKGVHWVKNTFLNHFREASGQLLCPVSIESALMLFVFI